MGIRTPSTSITAVVAAALFYCPTLAAEPSQSFLECEALLAKHAARHRDDANQILHRYQSIRDRSLQRAHETDRTNLRPAFRRLEKRALLDDAYKVYVEEAIESMSEIRGDPTAEIECASKRGIRETYEANLNRYEYIVETLGDDVEHRASLESLGSNEGLVVLAWNSNVHGGDVFINRLGSLGGVSIYPKGAGETFVVLKAKAGEYNWDRLTQKFFNTRRIYEFKDEKLRFRVEPGKLNYTGVLMHEANYAGYFRAKLHDRLTIVLLVLEQRHPELLQKYEVANGLYPDDPFIDYYLSEKRAMRGE